MVEASCPGGACRRVGMAENKLMSWSQLNLFGLSSMKNVSCLSHSSGEFSSAGVCIQLGLCPYALHLPTLMNQHYHQASPLLRKDFPTLFQLLSLSSFNRIWNLKELIQWKPAKTCMWGEGQFLVYSYWEQNRRVVNRSVYSSTNTFSPSLCQHRKPF